MSFIRLPAVFCAWERKCTRHTKHTCMTRFHHFAMKMFSIWVFLSLSPAHTTCWVPSEKFDIHKRNIIDSSCLERRMKMDCYVRVGWKLDRELYMLHPSWPTQMHSRALSITRSPARCVSTAADVHDWQGLQQSIAKWLVTFNHAEQLVPSLIKKVTTWFSWNAACDACLIRRLRRLRHLGWGKYSKRRVIKSEWYF